MSGWVSRPGGFPVPSGDGDPKPVPRYHKLVIPGAATAIPWTQPGIQLSDLYDEQQSWIPGSIANGAGNGPGMTTGNIVPPRNEEGKYRAAAPECRQKKPGPDMTRRLRAFGATLSANGG